MTPRLEALKPDAQVRGLVRREAVRIVSAERLGGPPTRWRIAGDRVLVCGGRQWSLRAMATSTGCPECTISRRFKAHA